MRLHCVRCARARVCVCPLHTHALWSTTLVSPLVLTRRSSIERQIVATDAAAPANLHNRMVICQATRHCVPRVFIIHAHTLIARLCSDFDVDMFITAPHRRIRGGGGDGGVGFVCVCALCCHWVVASQKPGGGLSSLARLVTCSRIAFAFNG